MFLSTAMYSVLRAMTIPPEQAGVKCFPQRCNGDFSWCLSVAGYGQSRLDENVC